LYYQAYRKSFVYHAENERSTRLDSESFQQFAKAIRFERNDDPKEALRIYSELVETIDPEGKERHVFWECQARIDRLSDSEDLPTSLDQLGELINKARNASEPDQLVKAHDLLVRIQLRFAGEAEYESIVSRASSELKIVKQRITDENRFNESGAQSQDDDSAGDEGAQDE